MKSLWSLTKCFGFPFSIDTSERAKISLLVTTLTRVNRAWAQLPWVLIFPSKIVRLNVNEYGGKLVCQKGALLCASHTIDIHMEYSKNLSTGFFGGEGFILQGLTGEGEVFLKAGGTLIRRDLREGEQLRISSGCLVGFSSGVDYGTFLQSVYALSLRSRNFPLIS